MASDEANVKMTADDREAMAMWRRQLQAVDRLARAYENMGQRGSQASRGTGKEMENVLLKVFALDRGISTITSGFQQMANRVREFDEKRAGATVSRAETFSKFVVQSGLNTIADPAAQAKAIDAAKETINKAAIDAAVSPQQADQAATQLVSTKGATVEMVLGGGLQSFLKTLQAAGAMGKETNPTEMAAAAMRFMAATKQQPTAENFDRTLLAIHQMRKEGNLEFEHMNRFSAEAGSITQLGRIDPNEQLALFAKLLDTMEDRMASTSFRTTVERLSTAAADPTRVQALGRMGLRPSDVDFVPNAPGQSESFVQVMEKVRLGLERLPEDQRNANLQLLFGAESMKAATQFMDPNLRADIAQRVGTMTDRGARERDIVTATENAAAKLQRAETREQIALDTPAGERRKLIGEELEAVLAERVKRGEISEGQAGLTKERFEILKAFGLSPERAAGMASTSSALSYFNFRDAGAGRASRLAIERAGGDPSILGPSQDLTAESQLSEDGLRARIESAKSPGFFDSLSRRRTQALQRQGERAEAELERRRNTLVPDQPPAQPAPNQGAALDTTSLLNELKQINVGIQQLAAANRGPQRLTIEDTSGRARPARKAVESFNNVG